MQPECLFSELPDKILSASPSIQSIGQPTQLCDIQYNDKYKCIGFESLCPSVGLMLYEHGLPGDSIVKLSVSIHHTGKGLIYYQIEKPNGKYIRKYKKG